MRHIKIAAAALNQTPIAWDANVENIKRAITLAKEAGVTLLCLPELAITGYGCEDLFFSADTLARARACLNSIVPLTEGIAVCVGLPMQFQSSIYNVAAVLVDGKITGIVPKRVLAKDGVHYESRHFTAWPHGTTAALPDGTPWGDLVFTWGAAGSATVKFGVEICEDAWGPIRPATRMAEQGVDVILNPSASHFAVGLETRLAEISDPSAPTFCASKYDLRRTIVSESSRVFCVCYVYANLLGCESGRSIYDGDRMIASGGRIVAEGERLTLDRVALTVANIDLDENRSSRLKVAAIRTPESWQAGIAKAVSLGLFDYLRKSKLSGFVVSLSGGADSSAVAILAALALRRAWRESPPSAGESPLQQLIKQCADEAEFIKQALICVYQATPNNSSATRNSARSLAEELGATFVEIDIEPLVQAYQAAFSEAVGVSLSWDLHDIALQNLQSRVRSPGVWLLANLRNALLLTTGNRSEASTGYCTMDGDTSGGFAPINGLDKDTIRHWLLWQEHSGLENYGAIPALKYVNQLTPSAELRPLANAQTDEADLMPYPILAVIEREAVERGRSPLEVFTILDMRRHQGVGSQYLTGIDQLALGHFIARFFRLFSASQW